MNNRRFMWIAVCGPAVFTLACNLPLAGTEEGQPEATTETVPEPAIEVTATPAVAPEGGFVGAPAVDVSTLPHLAIPATGIGGIFCDATPTGPGVSVTPIISDLNQLCLYNFPTAAGSQPVSVTLTDPTGESYTASFSYAAREDGSVYLADWRGESAGYIDDGTSGFTTTPHLAITFLASANMPAGAWTASAQTADGSVTVPPTPITVERQGEVISIVRSPDSGPFEYPAQNTFTAGETLYIFGAGFDPGAALVFALYYQDPANPTSEFGTPTLTPLYAAQVTPDGSGNFNLQFVVGASTPAGTYFTTAAPAITDQLFINPFAGVFQIE